MSLVRPAMRIQPTTHYDARSAKDRGDILDQKPCLCSGWEFQLIIRHRSAMRTSNLLLKLKKNVNAFENQQETIDETLHNIMEGAFEKVFPAIIKHVEKISTMVSLFLVENNHMKAANYVVFAAIILLLILLSMVLFALMLLLTR
ncbi:hypothetical protein Y032_0002g898 [Ancylostoma ceylanicum]|uniref:Uncharacterized protein n=1 Tax=Ancylostoma ceylanicum TaxID=53326 RepID=A0A016W3R8_9BILA|nr:hypothetical protein Y032_0002g898 [Ancylostoma ceylanicum]